MRAAVALAASAALLFASAGARAEAVSTGSIPTARIPPLAKSLDGVPLYGKPIAGLVLGGSEGTHPWLKTQGSKVPMCIEVEAGGPTRMLTTASDSEIANKPFRIERLAQDNDGSVRLEVVDGWFDATLGKPREIRVTPVALAKVAEGPAGFSVYAYRDGKHVVLLAPTEGSASFREADPASGVEGVPIGNSDCGFTRIQLMLTSKTGSSGMGFELEPSAWPAAPLPKSKEARPKVWVSVSTSKVARDPEPLLAISLRTFAR